GHPGVSMYIQDGGPATVWADADPVETDRLGIWRSEDWFQITIENFEQANPLKKIWIQLTYKADEQPDIYAEVPGVSGPHWATLINQEPISGSDYMHQTWEILIEPNPDSEIIYILPGTCTGWLDQVVIDTICTVPEPTTIFLLGFGGLLLLRKRRG
ncbi:MAG: PEP-CTERM sorting domain-containing protein, partial [Planctomycetota bacterium]